MVKNEATSLNRQDDDSSGAECKVMFAFFMNETVAVSMQLLVCVFAHSLALYTEALTGLVDMAAYLIAFFCEYQKKTASDERREMYDVIGSFCSLFCLLGATMEMGKIALSTLLSSPAAAAAPGQSPNGQLLIVVTVINMILDGVVLYYAYTILRRQKEGSGCNVSSAVLHMSVDFIRCIALMINGIIIAMCPKIAVLADASTSLLLCIIVLASMAPMISDLSTSISNVAVRHVYRNRLDNRKGEGVLPWQGKELPALSKRRDSPGV